MQQLQKTNGTQPKNPQNIPVITGDYADVLIKISKLITHGDLSSLNDIQRLEYYNALCESMGLNKLTRPFEFIELDKKLTLYARKDCTEQLRKIHGIGFEKIEHARDGDLYIVTAYAKDKNGKPDVATGVIPFTQPARIKDGWDKVKNRPNWIPNPNAGKPVEAADMAILIMKTETKAKRRATLSICGLAMLDESEIESIPLEKNITPKEPINPKEYNLEHPAVNSAIENETKTEQMEDKPTPEQVKRLEELAAILTKGPGYIESVIRTRYPHENVQLIKRVFIEKWLEKLENQLEEKQQNELENKDFLNELGSVE